MTMIKGIAASNGIAIAKAYKLVMPDLTVEKVTVEDVEKEIKAYEDAMDHTAKELEVIKEAASKNLSAEEAAVFDAHALVLSDPELKTQVEDKIRNEKINADAALDEVANTFIAMFESMDDDYFRERAADIKDVSRRLLANLLGKSLPNPALIDEEVVIIADDLTPSDTAQLNKNLVRGFATNIGGRTSHSAIMARSLEIPAVVSCKTITDETNDADMVVLDGEAGIVIINPSDDEIKEYQAKREAFIAYKEELKKMKNEKSVTLDDHHVELVANIGSPKDIQGVLDNGGEGVGLFRTEFLYMESAQLPTEEEQFNVYKEVLEGLEGKPAVVRTLDIGGDKEIEAIDLPKEMNPFLGVRAVRLCFQREDIFRVQLRALLRASVYGDLRIMFPMIATLDEFRKAKGILMEEKEKLVPKQVIDAINEYFDEPIVTTDVGQNQMWTTQFLQLYGRRQLLTSGGLGTMGYGLPAAIGAAIGNPGREVVCVSGDGGFQMNSQEIATAVIQELPITICILNNGYLGMVRQWQDLFYDKAYAGTCLRRRKSCEHHCDGDFSKCPPYTPDFVKLAESYGAQGIRVFKKEEIIPAFEKAKTKTDGPTIIEFIIENEELVMPMVKPNGSITDLIMERGEE